MATAKPATLTITSKNYSSWSLRGWLMARVAGLEFEEIVIPLDLPDTQASIRKHSPSGRVPVLLHRGLAVWESLAIADFERILTSTDACLTRQYQAMLATDNIDLEFAASGIRRLAEIAWSVNEKTENIGARRLYTVMERLLEEVSFEAGSGERTQIVIDAPFVDARLKTLAGSEDLARYVL